VACLPYVLPLVSTVLAGEEDTDLAALVDHNVHLLLIGFLREKHRDPLAADRMCDVMLVLHEILATGARLPCEHIEPSGNLLGGRGGGGSSSGACFSFDFGGKSST
jgi:hypothetical protein